MQVIVYGLPATVSPAAREHDSTPVIPVLPAFWPETNPLSWAVSAGSAEP